jgi:putative Mg2+ transporter-C (MgtC) family protein
MNRVKYGEIFPLRIHSIDFIEYGEIMLSNTELILRLILAAALGSLIGFERERLSWAAGLRTHMLVCVGSTLMMIVSAFGFADILGTGNVTLDPSRVAAQVVSGIGFLGAGSILMRGEMVRGLTTAASIWAVAGVGLAVGGGMYVAAVGATVLILIILAGLKPLETRLHENRQRYQISLLADRGAITLQTVNEALGIGAVRVKQFIVLADKNYADREEIHITISRLSERQLTVICERLSQIDGVHEIKMDDDAEKGTKELR